MTNYKQKQWQADKLGDLVNLVLASLIIGQLTAQTFNIALAVLAIAGSLITWVYIHIILKN